MASNFGSQIPLTVQPGGINSGIKGINYQVNLLLLAVTKSFRDSNNTNFTISTEIKEAEPFDDVILESNGVSRFIQTKYKELPISLEFQDFFNEKKKNFYLGKYFCGYLNIMENFNNVSDFVICTNNVIPNSLTLIDGMGSGEKLIFLKITGSDEIFGSFNGCFKLDRSCATTIRKRLIRSLKKSGFDPTAQVDKYLDGFLSNLVFVFELEREHIDKEIDDFIESYFKLSFGDCPKSILKSTLYDWIETMKAVKSINRQNFEKYLEETKTKTKIIPNVIDRSSALFRSSNFTFKIHTKVRDFVRNFKIGPNQLNYLQVMEGDTFLSSCIIKQELQPKTSDELLFLSTNSPFGIKDGLKIFEMENCFNFLIFVECKEKIIEDHFKDQIKIILRKDQRKRALIITDQVRSKFEADVVLNDENLLKLQEIKLSDLTQLSLDCFLFEKELKLQGENIKIKSILDSSDQVLIEKINLQDLVDIQDIGRNVVDGKNFDPDLYIQRKLMKQNIIKKEILTDKENEKIVESEILFVTSCSQFPDANVHLLEPQNVGNDFVWKKTQGKIDYLLNYVKAHEGTPFEDPWSTQITSGIEFILSDMAGMGKTFWLNNLAQELKKKHKDYFIVNISFNDYTAYFESNTFDNIDSVIKFFESEELKLRNDTEKELFRVACTKTGKVIVILDGLDEVCPKSEAEMFKMIEEVRKTKISGIYISTRPELKRILEKKFKNFCHELLPFSQQDQLDFLMKLWSREGQGNLSYDELQAVAEKVVLLVKQKELAEITGIPLIIKMLAQIFDSGMLIEATQSEKVVEDTISNLLHLYQVFVDKKIERYFVEKLELDLSKKGNQRIAMILKPTYITLYKKLALKLILPQHLNLFKENYEFTSIEMEEMIECGLILSDFEIKFMHRTIAEYFVFLVLQEKFGDEKNAQFLVCAVLCERKFKVIQSFVNCWIDKWNNNDDILELFGKIIIEESDRILKESIKIACKAKHCNIFEFIFKSLFELKSEAATKYLSKLLLTDYFTVLESSTENPEICLLLLSMLKQNISDIEFWNQFQESNDVFFRNLLRHNYNSKILHKIFDEICQIESEKKIYYLETYFWTFMSQYNTYKDNSFDDFLSFFVSVKGLKSFMQVFSLNREINDNLFSSNHLINNALRILKFIELPNYKHLFDALGKIAFRQVLSSAKCQYHPYYQEIRQKLISEKLKTDLSDQELNELRTVSEEILKINGEDVKIIENIALQSLACFYFYENCSDNQIIQIFFYDVLESNNFDEISFNLIYNCKLLGNLCGRFIFDHLNYEVDKSSNDLKLQKFSPMSATEFCKKLKSKRFEKYGKMFYDEFRKNFEDSFAFFLLHSMMESLDSEDDHKKLNWVLSFDDGDRVTFDCLRYFLNFWKHCKLNLASDFDFDMKSAIIKNYEFILQGHDIHEMCLRLIKWIVGKYGNDHHTLEYQDSDGNTIFHHILEENVKAGFMNAIFDDLPNEVLKKILSVKNHRGQNFLFKINFTNGDFLKKIKEKFGYEYFENTLLERDENGDMCIVSVSHHLNAIFK